MVYTFLLTALTWDKGIIILFMLIVGELIKRKFINFLKLQVLVVCLLFSISATAYDFIVDGMYFNVLSQDDLTCEITFGGQKYEGDIIIPEHVMFDGKTFTVIGIHGDELGYLGAFEDCVDLKSVSIPHTITYIGDYAFAGCSGLANIYVPNSVAFIGEQVFGFCPVLSDIVFEDGSNELKISSNAFSVGLGDERTPVKAIYLGRDVSSDNTPFSGLKSLLSVTIGNTVTTITDNAFYNCSNLKSVNIGNSVETIGQSAFYSCSSLTDLSIGSSVVSIKKSAFSNCNSMTDINIPKSVEEIGASAFSNCNSMTDINIPESVEEIGVGAFSNCRSLAEINVDGGNQNYASIDGCLYSKNVTTLFCCPGAKLSISIPNTVMSISDNSFEGCANLTSIDIPSSISCIGNYAFYNCTGLTNIVIPNSVTSIGESAFRNCYGLTSIDIPSFVTQIDACTFENCSSLARVKIPNSITVIGHYAFSNCSSLLSIDIPNSVKLIDYLAFNYCSKLERIVLGESVQTMGSDVFYGCEGLKEIYCLMKRPVPIRGAYGFGFSENVYENAVLYVPVGCESKYATVEPWCLFYNIKEMVITGIDNNVMVVNEQNVKVEDGSIINADGKAINIYTINGQCVYSGSDSKISNLAKDIYIVKSDGKAVKVAL